jgi:hypothetical protein
VRIVRQASIKIPKYPLPFLDKSVPFFLLNVYRSRRDPACRNLGLVPGPLLTRECSRALTEVKSNVVRCNVVQFVKWARVSDCAQERAVLEVPLQ